MIRGVLLKAALVMIPAAVIVGALTSQSSEATAAPVVSDAGAAASSEPQTESNRGVAVAALAAARNAVAQAGKESPQHGEALAQLERAEALLANAQYREAAAAADSAWRLVSGRSGEKTKFTVEVAADGKTEVRSTAGQSVHVEAQGVTEPLYPGEAVVVAKGERPRRTVTPPQRPVATKEPPKVEARTLPAPQTTAPGDKETVLAKAITGGVGPVVLRWNAVSGATGYEVEVTPKSGKALRLKARGTVTAIAALPEGTYSWQVRAVDGELKSSPSPRRSFELKSDGLKLEVKGTEWK